MRDPIWGVVAVVLLLALAQPYLPWTRSYKRRKALADAEARRVQAELDRDRPPCPYCAGSGWVKVAITPLGGDTIIRRRPCPQSTRPGHPWTS
jgi:hypothetical protein